MPWGNRNEKMLVAVKSNLDDNGWANPFELTYNDEDFEIKDPVRSMKLINNAIRYKCNIDGKAIELFTAGEEWWILV
ncbi:hypothetical protein [Clostridium psychrophilum]|uniref:hypothetical protein n=1 Tax=Clostridium psychrophilum TaxID=132926 RepID=UPI001C0BF201|nr:hypothetical protein [Clostridium psychrophilum]MBU3183071.1 hypothetical protein [Clostridium psychrophilum]